MKKLFLSLIIVAMFSSMAMAYTFDGDVDPAQFFKYTLVEMEQTGPQSVITSLKSNNMNPLYAINVILTQQGRVYIIAYAYYDKMVLRHFLLIKGHYTEQLPNPEIIKMLEGKLNKLHGVTGV